MNELKHLITLVKNSTQPVEKVVQAYFAETVWSLLKEEFTHLSDSEKKALYRMLNQERCK